MADRRVSGIRIGVLIAGVTAGSLLLTAVPQGQQQTQGRGRAGQVQTPQVPTVGVPQIKVPTINVPDATQTGPAGPDSRQQSETWVSPARMQGLVRASQLGLNYVPGEVLVKFKDGVGAPGQNRALSAMGSNQTADTVEWAAGLAVVRDANQPNAYVLADQMKAQAEVEFAEPNFIYRIDPFERAPVSAIPPQSGASTRNTRGRLASAPAGAPTDADYAAYQWNFQLINMPSAWDLQPGGSADVIVAVIDSGMTANSGTMTYPVWTGSSFQTVSMPFAANPDLPATRHYLPKDYVGPKVPGSPLVDTDGHATHVSGTIGETTNNALLVSGVAYNVRIMPIKVCASYWDQMIYRAQIGLPGFESDRSASCLNTDIADGIRYAVDNGARVINISLGGPGTSTSIQSALTYASNRGAFVAISMGNDFEEGNETSYPAFYAGSLDGVMAVASVGYNSAKAWYSSTGAHCEIAAPGGDSRTGTGRTDLGRVWQSTLIGNDLLGLVPRFDRYDKQPYQGTSMASPHVAGVAALLMSQMPLLTGAQVERILRMTATDLGAKGKDDVFGYGLIDPRKALFGYGINR